MLHSVPDDIAYRHQISYFSRGGSDYESVGVFKLYLYIVQLREFYITR